MNVVQVYSAESEMEASVIKGRLESEGIKSSIVPSLVTFYNTSVQGTYVPHGVFVEKDKADEAKKILNK